MNQVLDWLHKKDAAAENIETITQFVIKNGGIAYSLAQLEAYKNKAIDALNGFADSDVKKSLILFAEYVASENS